MPILGAKGENLGGRTHQSFQDLLKKQYAFRRDLIKGMFDQIMEHKALNLPEPRRPDQVNMTNNPLYCPYHRYVGHTIEDCITFKEWLQKAIDEKRINLDLEALNPDYHAVNVVTVKSTQEGGPQENTWVSLARVEHNLASIVLMKATTTRKETLVSTEEKTWSVVQRQAYLSKQVP